MRGFPPAALLFVAFWGFPANSSADAVAKRVGAETPLMRAIDEGRLDRVKRLIAQGADLEAVGPKGETAIFAALAHAHVDRRDERILRALLSAGSDLGARMPQGQTPLYFAIILNNPRLVRILLEGGAPSDQRLRGGGKGVEGFTPLMGAAWWNGNVEIASILVAGGADVNARSASGETALMVAANRNNPRFVKFLLDNGARRDIKNSRGMTALSAAHPGGREVIALLKGRASPRAAKPADRTPSGTYDFSPPGCGYAVTFPFPPKRENKTLRTPYGNRTLYRAFVERKNLDYYNASCSSPLPGKEYARANEGFLRKAVEKEMRGQGAELTSFDYQETAHGKMAHGTSRPAAARGAYNVQWAYYLGNGSRFFMNIGWSGYEPNPLQLKFLQSLKSARPAAAPAR